MKSNQFMISCHKVSCRLITKIHIYNLASLTKSGILIFCSAFNYVAFHSLVFFWPVFTHFLHLSAKGQQCLHEFINFSTIFQIWPCCNKDFNPVLFFKGRENGLTCAELLIMVMYSNWKFTLPLLEGQKLAMLKNCNPSKMSKSQFWIIAKIQNSYFAKS